ncbi:MAG: SEC-C domain-containing protein [Betaproteobacteria bacterium]|nr:SEC-C domain-containing protein [Betaproteobacteria bacterium]
MDDPRTRAPPGRNEPCPCGSGRRHKACLRALRRGRPGTLDAAMRGALEASRRVADDALALYARAGNRPRCRTRCTCWARPIAIGDHRPRSPACARPCDGSRPLPGRCSATSRTSWSHLPASRLASPGAVAPVARAPGRRRGRRVALRAGERRGAQPRSCGSSRRRSRPPSTDARGRRDRRSTTDRRTGRPRIAAVAARSAGRVRLVARERRGAAATINEAVRCPGRLDRDPQLGRPFRARVSRRCCAAWPGGAGWGCSRSSASTPDGIFAGRGAWRPCVAARTASFGDSVGLAFVAGNPAISTGALFFSRALFDRVGGFRDLRYVHDWDFCLRAAWSTSRCSCPSRSTISDPRRQHDRYAGGAPTRRRTSCCARSTAAPAAPATPNPFAPLPSVWGRVFWLRAIEGGRASLLPPGVVERSRTSCWGGRSWRSPGLAQRDRRAQSARPRFRGRVDGWAARRARATTR